MIQVTYGLHRVILPGDGQSTQDNNNNINNRKRFGTWKIRGNSLLCCGIHLKIILKGGYSEILSSQPCDIILATIARKSASDKISISWSADRDYSAEVYPLLLWRFQISRDNLWMKHCLAASSCSSCPFSIVLSQPPTLRGIESSC